MYLKNEAPPTINDNENPKFPNLAHRVFEQKDPKDLVFSVQVISNDTTTAIMFVAKTGVIWRFLRDHNIVGMTFLN
jgi:hypothetical protein